MPISNIQMVSFRNHQQLDMDFSPGINVIWGENGSGKTAVLEAIHLLSIGKSFRTSKMTEIIKHEKDFFRVKGAFSSENKEDEVLFSQGKDRRQKIKINGKDVGRKTLIGQNPVIILSPEEQNITKGTPGNRRNYFDKLYSITSEEYLNNLSKFFSALKQRNALLRENKNKIVFEAWDETLAGLGAKVWKAKKELNEEFMTYLSTASSSYGDGSISIKLKIGNIDIDKKQMKEMLKETHDRDVINKQTTVGPHRDRISFLFNEKKLRNFGSQGEHKIALVLVKLAEFMFIKEKTGRAPIFLLDDLFAKLDLKRSDAVFELLKKNTQTIITNTDLFNLKNHGIDLETPDNKSFHLAR
jgi:DNA replication and repair protein RecF|tara:strand:- start:514 stop:1581 length:1068 start_codon:yes stop_codon:yes gene_type:complete